MPIDATVKSIKILTHEDKVVELKEGVSMMFDYATGWSGGMGEYGKSYQSTNGMGNITMQTIERAMENRRGWLVSWGHRSGQKPVLNGRVHSSNIKAILDVEYIER